MTEDIIKAQEIEDVAKAQEISVIDFVKSRDEYTIFEAETLRIVTGAVTETEAARNEALLLQRASELGKQKQFKKLLDKAFEDRAEFDKKYRSAEENVTNFTKQPISLKCGLYKCEKTVIAKPIEKCGNEEVKIISFVPVLPLALIDNMETGTQKVELGYLKENKWRRVCIDREIISSNTKIVSLANYGMDITSSNAKEMVMYFKELIALNEGNTISHSKSVCHLGWVKDVFVPYGEGFRIDDEGKNESLYSSIARKGLLDEWIEFVRPMRKNIYFRMQIAASFASVLIERTGTLPFVLHLWGGTGSGKTVGLMGAMSIWGNPSMGKLVRTMNMTNNALMDTAAFLHSIPFAGDELQTIKNRFGNYDNLIMQITEGINRGRMKYDKQETLKTWHNAFLFTGEEPCTKAGSGGGVINRVIEVEVTGKVVENGNEAANFFRSHYGTAGPLFTDIASAIDVMPFYEKYFEMLIQSGTTEKQAMAAALCMAADELTGSLIFEEKGKTLTLDEVKGFLKTSKEVSLSERAFEYICGEIARNMNRFGSDGYGEIWGKVNEAKGEIYINKNVLSQLLEGAGFSFDAVKREWAEKDYLRKYGVEFTTPQRIGNVLIRCVVLQTANEINKENEQLPF